MTTDPGWSTAFDSWVRSQSWFVLAVLGVVFLSTFLSLIKYSAEFVGWVQERRVDWRDAEYLKLGVLGAGINTAIFEQTLGTPTFLRKSDDGLVEKSYRGRGCWVQTIEADSGSVVLMAVTACLPDFNPTFETPAGGTVVLNRTKFAQFNPQPSSAALNAPDLDYFLSGATANSRFYDIYPGSNPSAYQTVWIGINDACAWDRQALPPAFPFQYRGHFRGGGNDVNAFRRAATVNTYAVASPLAPVSFSPFQIGVDRILTRTLQRP